MDSKIYEKNTLEFVTLAAEYCGFLEKTSKFSKLDFVTKLHKLLPLIYLKATLLQSTENGDLYDNETEIFVSEYDYSYIKNIVSEKFGSDDEFVPIYGKLENGYEEGELSECAADIYQDLKNFLGNYSTSSEEAMEASLCVCIESFKNYWGYRALSLAAALHFLIYEKQLTDDDDENSTENSFEEIDETKGGNSLINNFLENYHKKI